MMQKIRELTDTPEERRRWYQLAAALIALLTATGVLTDSLAPLVANTLLALGSLIVATAHVPNGEDKPGDK